VSDWSWGEQRPPGNGGQLDLLDAHIWGFSAGDWQAAEAMAPALEGADWPPDWMRDRDNAARIIVDPSVWPTPGLPGIEPSAARS